MTVAAALLLVMPVSMIFLPLPLRRRRPLVALGFVVLVTLPVAGRVLSASLRRANPPAVVVELQRTQRFGLGLDGRSCRSQCAAPTFG
jgi:hypothetical protein